MWSVPRKGHRLRVFLVGAWRSLSWAHSAVPFFLGIVGLGGV
jgi:hypothetical protein